VKEILHKAKLLYLPSFSSLLLDDIDGRIAREFWWTNKEFSFVDIIPRWYSTLVNHLGDAK
jgi:phosphatidylserine synthase